MEYQIRQAKMNDLDEILQLCAEHAAYEKADYSIEGKSINLSRLLFGPQAPLHCLIVKQGELTLGYATYSFEVSTWDAALYMHMDCLFLRAPYRSLGIGEKLVAIMAKEAQQKQCNIMQWQTPIFNERAIKFYHRIGATSKEKLRLYLDTESMKNLIMANNKNTF